MNWINSIVRPKIRDLWKKREVPENLWIKDPETGEMVFHRDLEANLWVVPNSGHHMRMPARKRVETFFDDGNYSDVKTPEVQADPHKFRDSKRYTDRLKEARAKSGEEEAILVAQGKVNGMDMTIAVQNFDFVAGSLGMAAGEAILAGMMKAVEDKTPFIMFAASGGARMQEGILSLMQMPRTTVGVQMLREAGLPYIVVLTNPTTGGVSASYAMLGDVHIAEPGAQIGFAGRRVIEQTVREKLPEDFQTAEYLLDHGMIDMVVPRLELKETIARICGILLKREVELPKLEAPVTEEVEDESIAEDPAEEAESDDKDAKEAEPAS
ncbi:MAG: acetyl-CoA carboxylase, carboxyltransferase subunit beta [Roseibium album]|uniref:Acetyl-coenzyme A carboxylase carboxyl transferase subunit beta n=1 Tax=Roseibium album TaxID=311410 RepID=A0A0M7AB20_9HYPH|nr:acetyl-CoA carboxylase, carboxyltransferase subunit beta [Roseibium album]MBG6145535.1 acetyl-CoA carboxylase carboxyl transferase subunit beta [Labrenzia sp. EL_142]MBG6157771.1 acetyl-CoA carboxylase carboxyl transferase subunit beta [Labrenzia sp. EL_162]MBG6174404.1 acetyl-CoA carboxylase carboxyl transferase subunit beta [Labrenzia sp. EL_132]MBG6195836.1 acetyl-CoA carboxylase carboxyl transferase subunit beta [Labrenzia sp. EL_159]MBG6201261.1 acetyl-CoA carboxylase carboxyl transfer